MRAEWSEFFSYARKYSSLNQQIFAKYSRQFNISINVLFHISAKPSFSPSLSRDNVPKKSRLLDQSRDIFAVRKNHKNGRQEEVAFLPRLKSELWYLSDGQQRRPGKMWTKIGWVSPWYGQCCRMPQRGLSWKYWKYLIFPVLWFSVSGDVVSQTNLEEMYS